MSKKNYLWKFSFHLKFPREKWKAWPVLESTLINVKAANTKLFYNKFQIPLSISHFSGKFLFFFNTLYLSVILETDTMITKTFHHFVKPTSTFIRTVFGKEPSKEKLVNCKSPLN